ncbi:YcaO-like family protein [Falsibacillus pallidus]|uniref:YcaO-like family protein n=1 Tax=Falsibacillus pallidus TaxID=493781 RepID=UPI003D952C8B
MIFNKRGDKSHNIPESLFVGKNLYYAFSKTNSFLLNGYMGPIGGNGISNDKKIAMKKAFSEMIERRNLMLGGSRLPSKKVISYDFINKTISEIPHELTTYSHDLPYPIDTTGTAVHPNSQIAIYNAIKELLEKNSLFLFWYGKLGKKIIVQNNFHELLPEITTKYSVRCFINESFSPLKVCIFFIFKDERIISTGVGSSIDWLKACRIAIEEAIVLYQQDMINSDFSSFILQEKFQSNFIDEKLNKYIKEFEQLQEYPTDTYYFDDKDEYPDNNGSLELLLSSLPSWIKELHSVIIPQKINRKLICIKVFSPNLFNHIPIKKYINCDLPIFREASLNKKQFHQIPDCIVK